jgi:hypothetical protein
MLLFCPLTELNGKKRSNTTAQKGSHKPTSKLEEE